MTPVTVFHRRKVALFGLGGSGLMTALALQAGGAEVIAYDDNAAAQQAARDRGISVYDLSREDFHQFAALILSPGVPLTHPRPHWAARIAEMAGVEVIGDIELFCRERQRSAPGAPFVAITGTNGKSTTTALCAHLLQSVGHQVAVGGNLGRAILDLPPPDSQLIHVIECSSFQIDLTPSLAPTIGILTNLSADHIDRHGSMERYVEIKSRLIRHAMVAFVSVDDPDSAAIAHANLNGGTLPVSVREGLDRGVVLEGEKIWWVGAAGVCVPIANLTNARNLRGPHNAQNAAFAAACAYQFGLSPEQITAGLDSFKGLAHRMEMIGQVSEILFVNDSKATNADSTQQALDTFEEIYWIVGGKAKAGGIEALRPRFSRIAKAFLIGESSEGFAKTLDGAVAFEHCGTLERAVEAATAAAQKGKSSERAILLSPACASYDQFNNFEHRGEAFRTLALAQIARLNGVAGTS